MLAKKSSIGDKEECPIPKQESQLKEPPFQRPSVCLTNWSRAMASSPRYLTRQVKERIFASRIIVIFEARKTPLSALIKGRSGLPQRTHFRVPRESRVHYVDVVAEYAVGAHRSPFLVSMVTISEWWTHVLRYWEFHIYMKCARCEGGEN